MKNFKNNLTIALLITFLFINVPVFAQNPIEKELSKIENSIWGFEYSKDDTQKRLSRIENNVFGNVNSKLSTQQRIKKLNETMGFESYEESLN